MRKHERFEIESPVTVGVRNMSPGAGLEFGRLCDIGPRGARFTLDRPLPMNANVVLLVHFSDPYDRDTTIRFEGTVTRVGVDAPYEIAVRFRNGARFIRGGLGDILRRDQKRKGKTVAIPLPRSEQKIRGRHLPGVRGGS